MGNSKSKSEDNFLSSRNGKNRIKKQMVCPICEMIFLAETLYADIDTHIESHGIDDTPPLIPEDQFFPKAELKILPIKNKISSLKVPWSVSHRELRISRDSILKTSKDLLLRLSSAELRSEFHINFQGETSSDAGGLTKEWLNLLASELLGEKNNLFVMTKCEDPKYIPVKHSREVDDYKIFGIVLGKAILENIPLNCMLSRVLLKHLLAKSCTLRDLKFLDSDLYRSIKYFLENPIDGVFFETFSVLSNGKSTNLVEAGDTVAVTDDNKEAYVLLRIEYEVYLGFSLAIESIKEGFFSVVPFEFLRGLGHEELNYMISGNPYINLKDWMVNTEYTGEYNSEHKVIRWFWEVVCGLDQSNLRKLLQFVTGTTQVPIEGFGKLKTVRGDPAMFKIIPTSFESFLLPRAHTCFNRLDLPIYPNKSVLKKALDEVLNYHVLGFGID